MDGDFAGIGKGGGFVGKIGKGEEEEEEGGEGGGGFLVSYDDNGERRGEEKERWMRKVGRVGVLWVLQG